MSFGCLVLQVVLVWERRWLATVGSDLKVMVLVWAHGIGVRNGVLVYRRGVDAKEVNAGFLEEIGRERKRKEKNEMKEGILVGLDRLKKRSGKKKGKKKKTKKKEKKKTKKKGLSGPWA